MPGAVLVVARELILDVLEAAPGRQLESDTLDAKIAAETGLAAKTIKNLRTELKEKGLIARRDRSTRHRQRRS
jgi:predicted transcriptional regulator